MASIEKGTLHMGIANAVMFIATYAIFIGLGKFILGPGQFGIYLIVVSMISIINQIFVAGIGQVVSKFVSEKEALGALIRNKMMLLTGSFSLGLAAVYFFMAKYIALALNDITLAPLIQLSSPIIFFHSLFSVNLGYTNGLKQFSRYGFMTITYNTFRALLMIALALMYGVPGAIAGFVIASLLGFVVSDISGKRMPLPSGKGEFDVKRVVTFGAPIAAFFLLLNLMLSIDLFFVKALMPAATSNLSAGFYGAAQTISRILPSIIFVVSMVAFPLISSTHSKKDDKKTKYYVSHSIRYALLALVPLGAVIAANSSGIITLLYSPEYIQGAQALAVLAIATVAYGFFMHLASMITSANKPAIPVCIGAAALFVSVVLNYALIPQYHLMGAAFASLCAMFTAAVIASAEARRLFGVFIGKKSFARILAAGIAVFAVSSFFETTGIMVAVESALGLGLYALVLFALGELNETDFSVLRNMFRRG